jgi:hypothetical protein
MAYVQLCYNQEALAMAYVQLCYNQEDLAMAYMQLCCSSIQTLLRSSNSGAWISSAIKFFEAFNLPQTYG